MPSKTDYIKNIKKNLLNKPLVHYAGITIKEEDELTEIASILSVIFQMYPIKSIDFKYRGHDNMLCVKAFDREFITKPYEGSHDWELMLKKLERAKHGVFTDIERSRD